MAPLPEVYKKANELKIIIFNQHDFKWAEEQAEKVGKLVAERAKEAGVEQVVFDRNGYLYHGRIKSLADGARAEGLKF